MKGVCATILTVSLFVFGNAHATAQSASEDIYDRTATTILKGTVSAVVLPEGAPVFLVLSVPGQSGRSEDWVIEGDSANRLIAAGWRPRMGVPIAQGQLIEVVVHRVKAGVDPVTRVPASEGALVASAKAQRLAYGTEIKLAGGKTVTFGGNK
jgi:hypothetical protein